MPTLNKLEYLDETKQQIKDALNTNFNAQIQDADTFRSYVSKISDIYTNWPKVEGEDTTLNLSPTKKGLMTLDLKGNTSQEGTPTPETPQDIHVVSGNNSINVCGKNLNKTSITVNLTSGNEKWIGARLDKVNWENGKTYYIKAFLEKQSNEVVQIENYEYKSIDNRRHTIVFNGKIPYVRVGANTLNANVINEEVKIMVSTEAFTDFEPYIGNTYPISLGMENLWKNQLSGFLSQSGAYPTTNSSYPSARYVLIPLIAGQSITLSGSTSTHGRVRYIDKSTNQVVGTISQETNAYYTSTAYFTAQFNNGTITANKEFIVGIMDISGNVNDLVVNYGTRPSTISDTPIELCKIGDYQDYIYKDNGKWYKHREIGKVVLNGSESWTREYGDNLFDLQDYLSSQPFATGYGISNYYKYNSIQSGIDANTVNGEFALQKAFVFNTYRYNIFIKNTDFSNIDDFKSWLSTHNTEVYYPLATPTYTEITDSTLISQLEALKTATSYDNKTNISQTNNDLPFIISASALMKGGN